jgi:hypothetical protein
MYVSPFPELKFRRSSASPTRRIVSRQGRCDSDELVSHHFEAAQDLTAPDSER